MWMRSLTHGTLRVGDVLRAPSGLLRIVRGVHYRNTGNDYVMFTIQRCSWTGRCVTHYMLSDLRCAGYTHTGKRVKLGTKFDLMFEDDIALPDRDKQIFSCCDVKGIP